MPPKPDTEFQAYLGLASFIAGLIAVVMLIASHPAPVEPVHKAYHKKSGGFTCLTIGSVTFCNPPGGED